ncbi:hypothetical protein D6833_13390, partial [Candidatus Parcubacteria bacterium]
MLTQLDVLNYCNAFGLSKDAAQQRRVARAADLCRQRKVTLVVRSRDYTYWQVSSQYDRGTYQVIEDHRTGAFHCNCPDSRKHYAGET